MRAKRQDNNQSEIAEQAKALGISYQSLHEIGKGCPDAIFGYAGINLFVEIKDGKNDLNDLQIEYHKEWKGQIVTIRNTNDLVTEFVRQSYKICGMLTEEMVVLLRNELISRIENLV